MTPRKYPSDDLGTALIQALPWLDAIDALAAAARALPDGTGDERALALALHNYRETARAVMGEAGDDAPQEGRGGGLCGPVGVEVSGMRIK